MRWVGQKVQWLSYWKHFVLVETRTRKIEMDDGDPDRSTSWMDQGLDDRVGRGKSGRQSF